MKIYKVEYLIHGKSRALRIEGVQTILDAVQAAEAVLNTVYKLDANIRSICEINK